MKRRIIKSQYGNPGIKPVNYGMYQDPRPAYSIQPQGYVLPEVQVVGTMPRLFDARNANFGGGYGLTTESVFDGNYDFSPEWGRSIYQTPFGNDTVYFDPQSMKYVWNDNGLVAVPTDRDNQEQRKQNFYKKVEGSSPMRGTNKTTHKRVKKEAANNKKKDK